MVIIGISCLYDEDSDYIQLRGEYCRAVEKAGALPLLIPVMKEKLLRELLQAVSGIVLSGGGDVDPYYYGEEPLPGHCRIYPARDMVELFLAREALRSNLPVLGICRGAQVLNIAAGGTIYQDLKLKEGTRLEHAQEAPRFHPFHEITVLDNTLLARALNGKKQMRVNSFHHQAVNELGRDLRICAVSPDGVIEGIESNSHPFALGVQWHPEGLADENVPGGMELFEALTRAAAGGH